MCRPSLQRMRSWLRPCSCLWLSAWWRKWSRRRRLKQKQRSVCFEAEKHTLVCFESGPKSSGVKVALKTSVNRSGL